MTEKFKVGDRVATVCSVHFNATGTVTGVDRDTDLYVIRLDNGDICRSDEYQMARAEPSERAIWSVHLNSIAYAAMRVEALLTEINNSDDTELKWRIEDSGLHAYIYGAPVDFWVRPVPGSGNAWGLTRS